MRSRGISHTQDGWIRDLPAADAIVAGFSTSPMAMILVDARRKDMPIVFANAAFTELTGYCSEEILNRNCRFLQGPGTDPAAVAKIRDAIAAAKPVSIDLLNFKKDGTPFWNALTVAPLNDDVGKPLFFFATSLDASERINALSNLAHHNSQLITDVATKIGELDSALDGHRRAIVEKEILLHELHHRVKNNLQMIAALTSLQIRNVEDTDARTALLSLQRRVNALGAVHRRLHHRATVGTMNLADVLEDMVPDAVSAYSHGNVSVQLTLQPVYADSALAAPAGLLLNELLAATIGVASQAEGHSVLSITLEQRGHYAVISFQSIWHDPSVPICELLPFDETSLTLGLARQVGGFVQSHPTPDGTRIELHIGTERNAWQISAF